MKHQFATMQPDHKLFKIAVLVGLACVLQISESLIPHPIPGLRLGLANMLTLTAMVVLGFGYALEVAILRSVLSSFIMGTFMSPTFILSIGGAVVSTLVMGLFYWMSGLCKYGRMSIIGISIIGAFVHNLVQLYLAYLLLVKHPGIFAFLPWLSLGAVATGWVVGVVTGGVCQRLQENYAGFPVNNSDFDGEVLQLRHYTPGDSWLHRLPAEIKLISLFALGVSLLVCTRFGFYAGVFFFLCAMLPVSHTPFRFFIAVTRKYLALILISFSLPLFFDSGTNVLVSLGMIRITGEGLHLGAIFAARILLLVMASALLVRVTSPTGLVGGLDRLLWPLHFFGISPHRIATILSLAWAALPQLWKTTRDAVASTDLKKIHNLRSLLPQLSNLVATLYLRTEPAHGLWKQTSSTEKHDPKDSWRSS